MSDLSHLLLSWFRQNGRKLPWRVVGGAHFDPYAVWISEIMLQQTTVKTVYDYFIRWMERFPTIQDLAKADLQDVLLMWQGLGYYTRAKKIYECAGVLMDKYHGKIPPNRDELLKLPGIGPYTASSICCFAFNMPETVVDGNVIRVLARVYGLTHAVSKEEIYALAVPLTPKDAGADYASAIMDLGATVCLPENPKCDECPWKQHCIARQKGIADQIPLIRKPEKKERHGILWLVQNSPGAYYIRKRAGKGLLSGLYEFPWVYREEKPPYPIKEKSLGQITHIFTHFKLVLDVYSCQTDDRQNDGGFFVPSDEFQNYPFPKLMLKVIQKMIEQK